MVEFSTYLGEAGSLHKIHKQIHQVSEYNETGRLVLSCFLKCGWY